jgi:tyrosinase
MRDFTGDSKNTLIFRFEEALRRIDPTVSLPFWDSTVDNDMDNPVNSALWTAEYFGNGVSDVTSGPAAGWVTDQGNLERNYGQASRLLSKDQIRRVLSKCELQVIQNTFFSF